VVAALVFGVLYVFRLQPLFGNDEIVHFPRAYYVQEGHAWTEYLGGFDYGGRVPVQLKEFNDGFREQVQNDHPDQQKIADLKARYLQEKITTNARAPLAFSSAGVYSAVAYVPSAVGIAVADSLHLPLVWYVYLARICSLLTYVVLVYFAIKYLPYGKPFLLVIALLPTAVTQAATIGMDGVVNSSSWLVIALSLAIFERRLKITPKLLAILAALCVVIVVTKQAYAPLVLLPLVIPARLYPFRYKKVWLWRAALGGGLLGLSAWYIGKTSAIAEVIHHIQRPGLHVNEAEQLHFVFQHFLQFLGMIFVQPFTIWAASIYAGMVGVMSNRLVYIPIPVIVFLYVLLLVTCFHKERPRLAKRDRLFVLGSSLAAFLGTFILINIGLYLSFTRVGFDHVEGLQGRYFLPLLPLLGVLLHVSMPNLFLKLSDRMARFIVYPGILTGLLFAIMAIH
jgi:uncharacterized membrane protein